MFKVTMSACLCLGALAVPAFADDYTGVRAIVVEEAGNSAAPFCVRVDVDKPGRTYKVGEEIHISVMSEKAGYLYLLDVQADGKVAVLFPNRLQQDNKIPATTKVSIPEQGSKFKLKIGTPTGKELVKAIVSLEPIKGVDLEKLQKSMVTEISTKELRSIYVEELKEQGSQKWAEHAVEITTFEDKITTRRHRRLALCIGISDFKDAKIRDLTVAHTDALKFATLLEKQCGFDEVVQLTDKTATKAAIEKAIRKDLVGKTGPGDEVVIFWSGHGGRIADVQPGDEKDGFDEMLIPYDTDVSNADTTRASCVVDDEFGRWIQDLDGRKVLLILDTCHSGGQSTNEKGLFAPAQPPQPKFDFLDGELSRAKDVGQKDAAMLAASQARQVAFERQEGDLSVLTYCIIDYIEKSQGAVELRDLYKYVEDAVPAYVKKNFDGAVQSPVLDGTITPDFVIKQTR